MIHKMHKLKGEIEYFVIKFDLTRGYDMLK